MDIIQPATGSIKLQCFQEPVDKEEVRAGLSEIHEAKELVSTIEDNELNFDAVLWKITHHFDVLDQAKNPTDPYMSTALEEAIVVLIMTQKPVNDLSISINDIVATLKSIGNHQSSNAQINAKLDTYRQLKGLDLFLLNGVRRYNLRQNNPGREVWLAVNRFKTLPEGPIHNCYNRLSVGDQLDFSRTCIYAYKLHESLIMRKLSLLGTCKLEQSLFSAKRLYLRHPDCRDEKEMLIDQKGIDHFKTKFGLDCGPFMLSQIKKGVTVDEAKKHLAEREAEADASKLREQYKDLSDAQFSALKKYIFDGSLTNQMLESLTPEKIIVLAKLLQSRAIQRWLDFSTLVLDQPLPNFLEMVRILSLERIRRVLEGDINLSGRQQLKVRFLKKATWAGANAYCQLYRLCENYSGGLLVCEGFTFSNKYFCEFLDFRILSLNSDETKIFNNEMFQRCCNDKLITADQFFRLSRVEKIVLNNPDFLSLIKNKKLTLQEMNEAPESGWRTLATHYTKLQQAIDVKLITPQQVLQSDQEDLELLNNNQVTEYFGRIQRKNPQKENCVIS